MRIQAKRRPVCNSRGERGWKPREETIRRKPGYESYRERNRLEKHEAKEGKNPKWKQKVYFPVLWSALTKTTRVKRKRATSMAL